MMVNGYLDDAGERVKVYEDFYSAWRHFHEMKHLGAKEQDLTKWAQDIVNAAAAVERMRSHDH